MAAPPNTDTKKAKGKSQSKTPAKPRVKSLDDKALKAWKEQHTATGIRVQDITLLHNSQPKTAYYLSLTGSKALRDLFTDNSAIEEYAKPYVTWYHSEPSQGLLPKCSQKATSATIKTIVREFLRKCEDLNKIATWEDLSQLDVEDGAFTWSEKDWSTMSMVWVITKLLNAPSLAHCWQPHDGSRDFYSKEVHHIGGVEYVSENIGRAYVLVKAYRSYVNYSNSSTFNTKNPQDKLESVEYLSSDMLLQRTAGDPTESVAERLVGHGFMDYLEQYGHIFAHDQLLEEEDANGLASSEESAESQDQDALAIVKQYTELGVNELPPLTEPEQIEVCRGLWKNCQISYPAREDLTKIPQSKPDMDAVALNQSAIAEEEAGQAIVEAAQDLKLATSEAELEAQRATLTRATFLETQRKLNKDTAKPPTYEEAAELLGLTLPPRPDIPDTVVNAKDRTEFIKQLRPYAELAWNDKLRLKPHQVTGTAFVVQTTLSAARGCILADEMGLGKTVSALAAIEHIAKMAKTTGESPYGLTHKGDGSPKFLPNLVLCPANSVNVWMSDIDSKFTTEHLRVKVWFSTPNHSKNLYKARTLGNRLDDIRGFLASLDTRNPATQGVIILSSYATWASRSLDDPSARGTTPGKRKVVNNAFGGDELEGIGDEDFGRQPMNNKRIEAMSSNLAGLFSCVTCDEAHLLKNPMTKEFVAVDLAKIHAKVLMSGTPIGNTAPDFYGLLKLMWNENFHGHINEMVQDDEDEYGHDPLALYERLNQTIDRQWDKIERFDEKFSEKNFLQFIPLMDPRRFRSVVDVEKNAATAASVTSIVLPPIFKLVVLKRSKATEQEVGGYTVTLGADIPIPHFRVVELEMSPAQANKYNNIHLRELSHLQVVGVKKSEDGKSGGGNTSAVRRLGIASLNPQSDMLFRRLDKEKMANHKYLTLPSANLLSHWQMYTRPTSNLPFYPDRLTFLKYMLSLSQKLQYTLGRVGQWVLEEGRKLIIFLYWPTNLHAVTVALHGLGVRYTTLRSDQENEDRAKAINEFNHPSSGINIMVTTLRVAATSLNLQAASRVLMPDVPPSYMLLAQAGSRVYRIGQKEEQIIEVIALLDTYDQIICSRAEKKQIPIISGTAGLRPTEEECHLWALKKFQGMQKNPDPDEMAKAKEEYATEVCAKAARNLYRDAIGARTSFEFWDDLNVEARKLLDGEKAGIKDETERAEKKKLMDDAFMKAAELKRNTKMADYNFVHYALSRSMAIPPKLLTMMEDSEVRAAMLATAEKIKQQREEAAEAKQASRSASASAAKTNRKSKTLQIRKRKRLSDVDSDTDTDDLSSPAATAASKPHKRSKVVISSAPKNTGLSIFQPSSNPPKPASNPVLATAGLVPAQAQMPSLDVNMTGIDDDRVPPSPSIEAIMASTEFRDEWGQLTSESNPNAGSEGVGTDTNDIPASSFDSARQSPKPSDDPTENGANNPPSSPAADATAANTPRTQFSTPPPHPEPAKTATEEQRGQQTTIDDGAAQSSSQSKGSGGKSADGGDSIAGKKSGEQLEIE